MTTLRARMSSIAFILLLAALLAGCSTLSPGQPMPAETPLPPETEPSIRVAGVWEGMISMTGSGAAIGIYHGYARMQLSETDGSVHGEAVYYLSEDDFTEGDERWGYRGTLSGERQGSRVTLTGEVGAADATVAFEGELDGDTLAGSATLEGPYLDELEPLSFHFERR